MLSDVALACTTGGTNQFDDCMVSGVEEYLYIVSTSLACTASRTPPGCSLVDDLRPIEMSGAKSPHLQERRLGLVQERVGGYCIPLQAVVIQMGHGRVTYEIHIAEGASASEMRVAVTECNIADIRWRR